MEEHRMTQQLQFNPIDLLALTNFRQAKSMMDQSLNGAVMARLQKFGGTGAKLRGAMMQFELHDRYIVIADQLEGLWAGVGYFMPSDDSFSYPWVGMTLAVDTQALSNAKAVVDAMQAILLAKRGEWSGTDVTLTNQWVSINRQQPLHNFLTGEDHQRQVTGYLLDCLEALESIRLSYPQLPWYKPAPTDEAVDAIDAVPLTGQESGAEQA